MRKIMFNNDYIMAINNKLSFHNNISSKNYDRFKGKVIKDFKGLVAGSEKIEIFFEDNCGMILEHDQDCCEYVSVDQVDNDVHRHLGAIFLFLIEKTVNNEDCPQWSMEENHDDSMTSTFYDLVTSKGRLSFRWKGESNGYYSESVDVKHYMNQMRIDNEN